MQKIKGGDNLISRFATAATSLGPFLPCPPPSPLHNKIKKLRNSKLPSEVLGLFFNGWRNFPRSGSRFDRNIKAAAGICVIVPRGAFEAGKIKVCGNPGRKVIALSAHAPLPITFRVGEGEESLCNGTFVPTIMKLFDPHGEKKIEAVVNYSSKGGERGEDEICNYCSKII